MDLRDRLRAALAGRYEIEDEIGRGGMAVVYLARDLKLGRGVAIKVLRPEFTASLIADRFLQEIKIAAQLEHPGIVPLFESDSSDGLLWYAMPHIKGETLQQRLVRETQLPVDEAVRITCEVAEALSYAHGQGVIHRDIKPANILFSDGHPLVSDFGIAKAFTEAGGPTYTATAVGIGTPGYMSPEQATGEKNVDVRTDVYSLACVLYEMLAGEPPYTGPTAQAIMAKQLSLPVPSVCTLRETAPDDLDKVLRRAFGKVPADRFSTVEEFIGALMSAATGTPQPPTRWVRLAVAAGAAALVITTLGLLNGGVDDPPAQPPGLGSGALDPKRIAVLYFDDLTPGKTLGHLASGLTEDLIDELSQVRSLRVISPNGVRPHQGRATPIDSLARALGVGTIVGGSIASSGPQLRVTVRLIDALSGQQLQSRTLEQRSENLFILQDKLTAEVAQFLRERLGQEVRLREQRAETRSIRAWELVQQAQELTWLGRAHIRSGDVLGAAQPLLRADSLFARAQNLDPSWTAPLVGRGGVAISLTFVLPRPDQVPQAAAEPAAKGPGAVSLYWMRRAIDHAEQALRLHAGAPEALAVRGEARFHLGILGSPTETDSLLPLAEADLLAAVDAKPTLAHAWYTLGHLYDLNGRFADAARAAQRAFDEDAFLSQVRSVVSLLFFASLHNERFDDARSWCEVGRQRYAGDPRFMECDLTLLGWAGRGRRDVTVAWQLVHGIEQRDTLGMLSSTWAYRRLIVAAVLARSGLRDSAVAVIARTQVELPAHSSKPAPDVEAYVRLLLGDTDAALGLLAVYLDAAPQARGYVARSPWYRSLSGDPRFHVLVRPAS